MKQLHFTTRSQWRNWLARNHDREEAGIWLVFFKKATGRPGIDYEESIEEALCFGWIDSIVKRIDDDKYCRKFSPRRKNSRWSSLNKRRVAKVIEEGRMTAFGLAKIEAAKKSGQWEIDPRPVITRTIPQDMLRALAQNRKARDFFEGLAPTYQRQFIAWIDTAKRPETRAARLKESLALLESNRKLGLI